MDEAEAEHEPLLPSDPAEKELARNVRAFILGDPSADLSGFPQTTRDNKGAVYAGMQLAMRDRTYSADEDCKARLTQVSRRVSSLPKPQPVKKAKKAKVA